jgi:4-amino-4-deoxy-L-arabinose transferase-like glycosyltransferase
VNNLCIVKGERRFLAVLFLGSFLLRACVFAFYTSKQERYFNFDSHEYSTVAQSVVAGDGITNYYGGPQFKRVPGYALFLALCYWLFGHNDVAALWLQVIAASLIPVLVYFLSIALFPGLQGVARVASCLAALHVGFTLFSGLMFSESLFVIFLLGAFIVFFGAFKNGVLASGYKVFILVGLLLGLASLVRPVGNYVVAGMCFFIVIFGKRFALSVLQMGALVLSWLAVVGPWLIRNYMLSGALFFQTLDGMHFLKHYAARIVMHSQEITYQDALNKVVCEYQQNADSFEKSGGVMNEYEQSVVAQNISFAYARRFPFYACKLACVNLFKTLFGLYSSELMYMDSNKDLPQYSPARSLRDSFHRFLFPRVNHWGIRVVIYYEIFYMIVLWLGMLLFFVKALYDTRVRDVLYKVVPFIGGVIFLSLACGFARLRMPIEPFLIVMLARSFSESLFRLME